MEIVQTPLQVFKMHVPRVRSFNKLEAEHIQHSLRRSSRRPTIENLPIIPSSPLLRLMRSVHCPGSRKTPPHFPPSQPMLPNPQTAQPFFTPKTRRNPSPHNRGGDCRRDCATTQPKSVLLTRISQIGRAHV